MDYVGLATRVVKHLQKKSMLSPLQFDEAIGVALLGISKLLYELDFHEGPDFVYRAVAWARKEVLNERQKLLAQSRSSYEECPLEIHIEASGSLEDDPYIRVLRRELRNLVLSSVLLSPKQKQLFVLLDFLHPKSDFNDLCKLLKVEPATLKRLLAGLEKYCEEVLK